MAKLSERFMDWVRRLYAKRGLEFTKFDNILWGFWVYVGPTLLFIPVLFFLMKWFVIDFLLAKRGFNEMVAWGLIILVCRPLVIDVFTKVLTYRDKMKE